MVKVCKRHADNPVMIYHQCVGCELEWLQADVKQLRIEIRSLKKEKYQLVMQVVERNAEISELKEENERLQREIKRYAELEKALREILETIFPPPNIGTVSDLDNLKIYKTQRKIAELAGLESEEDARV